MEERIVPYDLIGGEQGVRDLCSAFYRNMKSSGEAETLKGMHSENTSSIEDRLFKYLSSWLGGHG